jgi:hypothetical protein
VITHDPTTAAALRRSHTRSVRVTVHDPSVDKATVLPVTSGTLTLDGNAAAIRRVTFTVAEPASQTVAGAVADGIVKVAVNVNGGVWQQIAQLRIGEVTTARGKTASVTAYDYANIPADFGLVTTYACKDSSQQPLTTVGAIQDLIRVAFPQERKDPQKPENNWTPPDYLIPEFVVGQGVDTTVKPAAGTVFTGDRWAAITALADSLGATVRNDHLGRFVIAKTSTTSPTPVWSADAGRGGILVEASTEWTREGQYNAVALTCSPPTGGSIFVYVVDNDPTSPTFYTGPFGKRPRSERNDVITDRAKAIEAARSILAKSKGEARSINLRTVYNPFLEPGDAFTHDRNLYVVDSVDLPLTGGAMTLRARLIGAAPNATTDIYVDPHLERYGDI